MIEEKGILFHVDATQSFGKLVDELLTVKYNMLSMSAHKIGGPQGIGALILRKHGKIDTSQEGVSEKVVKILCDKGMVDPFEDIAMEVSSAKKWE